MKKIFLFSAIAAFALGFSSCASEQEDIFGASAAERMDQAVSDYDARLKDSEGGWVMEYLPDFGQDLELIAVRFNKDGSCTMGMRTEETGYAYREDVSLWQIIADNGPVLSFNTYNKCLHTYATPDPNYSSATGVYDGDGYGYEGDYEFNVINCEDNAEYVTLKGKKRGTYTRMTRLEPGTDFETYLQDVIDFKTNTFGEFAPNFIIMDMGDAKYKIEGIYNSRCNIYPYDGDALADASYWPFLITKHNGKYYLRFHDDFTASNDKVAREFAFDEATMQFVDVKDADCKIMGPSAEDVSSIFERSLYNGDTWRWNRKSTMSDSFKSLVDAVYAGITAYGSSYTMDDSHNIDFSLNSEKTKAMISLNYKSGRANTKVQYLYNVSFEGGKMKLTYDTHVNTNAKTFYTKIPSVQAFVDALGTDFEACATVIGGFSLSEINLKDNSGNLWVYAAYAQ